MRQISGSNISQSTVYPDPGLTQLKIPQMYVKVGHDNFFSSLPLQCFDQSTRNSKKLPVLDTVYFFNCLIIQCSCYRYDDRFLRHVSVFFRPLSGTNVSLNFTTTITYNKGVDSENERS